MLVIFDCDGVLVDSEPLAARVFSQHLAGFGVSLSAAECERRFRGHTMDYCLNLLNSDYPDTLPADFLASLARATEEAFGRDLQAMPGVKTVLKWLRSKGIGFCVASNGSLDKVRHSLDVTGLRNYFGERCFSSEQVLRGKPFPDLFLFAAERMGANSASTLVVEDSVAGVTAAMRANMKVLRYGEPLQIEGYDVTSFTQMQQLPLLIETLV